MATPSSLTFADLLRHHRAVAGLTQEELAARARLSVDAISTLERGARRRPRKETVMLLAEALALPAEERAAFASAARRAPAASLAATPAGAAATATALDDHAPTSPHNAVAPSAAPAEALPHGSVTFLFADVEGSTRLLHQVGGDRYADVLTDVHTLLRSVWAAHAGHELGTQGDRFFVVFASAADALAAAVAAQQALAAHGWPDAWPVGTHVRVRMGVHSGPALLTAGRYVGLEVHRAARIAAAGHGGQVVVSRAVTDQVTKFGYALPEGTRLRDLGTHRLPDLPQREQLYQLVPPELPSQPSIPADFPPLRTLDAWPGLRADLTGVALLSVVLLAVMGLLLPLVVPVFPWAIGLGAAGLAGLVLATMVLARPVQRVLQTAWRDARKPLVAVTSALLSLVVVSTTLFITKPPIFVGPQHLGYDFSYTYHQPPTHIGDAITIGLAESIETLAPTGLGTGNLGILSPIWQACIVQLPDLKLGLSGWRADQCTEVPTVDNGEESSDFRTTTFRIDARAVWSDGMPITAEDFLFGARLLADPNISEDDSPWNQMTLTALDAHTVQIHWAVPYFDYLTPLSWLHPVPLHVYAKDTFADMYDPTTGTYSTALAQQLTADASFNTAIPVDNGPFTVQSFVPNNQVVLVRNPRFFSKYFHRPALDRVTLLSAGKDLPTQAAADLNPVPQMEADVIGQYRRGELDLALPLEPLNLRQLQGIPRDEVVTSSTVDAKQLGLNERGSAPNARANGGVSIFKDLAVRKAFVEAFDRCAAVRAELGTIDCGDPNYFTNESDAAFPDPFYDSTFTLPPYNPPDAAKLLDHAGYPVVGGIRRYKDGTTPLQLTLVVTPGASGDMVIAQRIQQDYMRNLHLGVTVIVVNKVDFLNRLVSGTFDLLMDDPQTSTDPVLRLTGDLGPFDSADEVSPQNPNGTNPFGIIDAYANQRDQLAAQTSSEEQRTAILHSLERYFSQQYYVEPLYIKADITLTKSTLCNFKHWPNAVVGYDLWNIADWYVAPTCPS